MLEIAVELFVMIVVERCDYNLTGYRSVEHMTDDGEWTWRWWFCGREDTDFGG